MLAPPLVAPADSAFVGGVSAGNASTQEDFRRLRDRPDLLQVQCVRVQSCHGCRFTKGLPHRLSPW